MPFVYTNDFTNLEILLQYVIREHTVTSDIYVAIAIAINIYYTAKTQI